MRRRNRLRRFPALRRRDLRLKGEGDVAATFVERESEGADQVEETDPILTMIDDALEEL